MAATARLVSALPNELPLLLIGGGLANLTLARALADQGHGSAAHVRLFEKSPATSRPQYSLNLHQWAAAPLAKTLGQPRLVDEVTVDRDLGGRGRIESSVFDLETLRTLAPLDLPKGRTARVQRAELAAAISKQKVTIEHGKTFVRWEVVRDPQGREALSAVFDDGSEALGCAIVGGDGVHSAVRALLHPACTPKVLPVVAYTGRYKGKADLLLRLSPKVHPIPYAHRNDNDVFRVDVADDVALVHTFNQANTATATVQWMYFRRPLADADADPLWRPTRALGDADVIPVELYAELEALSARMAKDLAHFAGGMTEKGATLGVRNWLMRSVTLPKEPSTVAGADRVIVVGDAAHGTPILAGESASHSILDGLLLAQAVSKAFVGLGETSDPAWPITHPTADTQGPVLQAIRAWEAGQRERWVASVEDAEARCMGMLQPLEVWRKNAPAVEAAPADA